MKLENVVLKFLKNLTIHDEKITVYEDYRKFPCLTKRLS